jgi:Ni/Fe-hydrogenase subunit HybB-like protein
MTHSLTYRVLAVFGGLVLIVLGITTGFAAISFSVSNPTEIFTYHRLTPLAAIIAMVSVGFLMVTAGLAIILDSTTGYKLV